MASLSFVGVSIFASIYTPTSMGEWKNVAYIGVIAVFGFGFTSIVTLYALDPKVKWMETKKQIEGFRKNMWILLGLSWGAFLLLTTGLLIAFL